LLTPQVRQALQRQQLERAQAKDETSKGDFCPFSDLKWVLAHGKHVKVKALLKRFETFSSLLCQPELEGMI